MARGFVEIRLEGFDLRLVRSHELALRVGKKRVSPECTSSLYGGLGVVIRPNSVLVMYL